MAYRELGVTTIREVLRRWLRKPFVELQPQQRFAQARVEYGAVVWPGDIDVAPETLYARSVPI